jgi:hypothetical protein
MLWILKNKEPPNHWNNPFGWEHYTKKDEYNVDVMSHDRRITRLTGIVRSESCMEYYGFQRFYRANGSDYIVRATTVNGATTAYDPKEDEPFEAPYRKLDLT